jgi:DNA-binding NarL/FixJ family response regulator
MEYAQSVAMRWPSSRTGAFRPDPARQPAAAERRFRQTVPKLRASGYTGPIGVVSMDVSDTYFQQFQDYGVDFRIGKDEIDVETLQHIIREYVRYDMPDFWKDDYNV